MKTMLRLQDVCKDYGDFVLDRMNMEIPGGSIMGFVGENGAGKTTTIKLILNLISRDGGEIQVFDLDNIQQENTIKEEIGVVFDQCNFGDALNAMQVGKMLRGIYKNWDDDLYHSYLQKFRLPEKKTIKEYSKGMKMKLSIATALSHHPKLLILDEPTSGLDPIVRNEILDLFLDFIQDEDHAILFSSHITSDIEKVADYVTFLHKGQLVFSKSKDELLYDYGILKCGKEDFETIDKEDMVKYHRGNYGYEVLVANKEEAARKYPNMVMDNATIESIMLFYVGEGER
jgi:ABC-2 type transport system ATP-binding protein